MMNLRINPLLILLILFLIPADLWAQEQTTRVLTLEEATRIADAAEERARQDNWNVVITILDSGGHMILLRRMDGVQLGSIEIAIQKAKTSILYKRPTRSFQEIVAGGNTAITSLPGVLPFEGGIPIMDDGQVIGAIGVSGVTAQQDGIIGQAGIDAL